jgi:putative inorganic carbon (HCO3(-)) transporter
MFSELSISRSELYEKWIDRILWLTIVSVPIVILPFGVSDIFDAIKGPVLVLSGIAILLFLILNKKWEKSIITGLLLTYISLVLLASIFAHDPLLAFAGATNYGGRFEGFATISIYVLLFYAARNYLIVTKQKLIRALSFLLIVSIYSLVQYYQFDPLVIYKNYRPMIFSTIGNQNFLGSLMVMLCSLTFGLSVFYRKWYYFLFFTLFFSSLLASQTRGSWIAFGIVFIGLTLLTFLFYRTKILGVLIALALMIFVALVLNYSKKNALSNRTNSIKTEIKMKNEYGGSGRFKIWEITWGVIKDHPILGTGPENLKSVLKTEYKKELNAYYRMKGVTIDKAHNEYLHMAAVSGIPSLIVYLLLIGVIFWQNIPRMSKDKTKLIIGFAVFGYLVQAFSNISVIAVAPIFWILFGYFSRSSKEVF